MSKRRIGIILIISVFAIIIFGYVASAYFKNHNNKLVIYGNVDVRDVSLSFRVPGRVVKLHVDEGDHVIAGAVLANLDQDTYLADLEAAKAELIKAKAALVDAEIIYKRRHNLVKSGAVSKAEYDNAVANLDESRGRVDAAEAQLTKAKIALADTTLYAPSNGAILTRIREPGSVVAATQPIFTLTVDNPVWVRTYIEEPDLGRIYPGEKALVYTDSRPNQPYTGQIGYISPQAEFTPKNVETTSLRTDLVYRLRVIVDDPDHGLRQGMPVTVVIEKKITA